MSKRDEDDEKPRTDALSGLVQSRLARVPNANSGGLAAMTIGLTLGGCVAVGYFAGAWLDRRFATGFWMPIGVFVGMAAGFREMFVTLKKLSAQTKWPSSKAPQNDSESANRVLDNETKAVATLEPERNRPRIFQVPAPPTASFDKSRSSLQTSENQTLDATNAQSLTEKLLSDEPNPNEPNPKLNDDRLSP